MLVCGQKIAFSERSKGKIFLCCGLLVIFCSFISHLIGRETINIPEIFSSVHGFMGKTVKALTLGKIMISFIYFILFLFSMRDNDNDRLYILPMNRYNVAWPAATRAGSEEGWLLSKAKCSLLRSRILLILGRAVFWKLSITAANL